MKKIMSIIGALAILATALQSQSIITHLAGDTNNVAPLSTNLPGASATGWVIPVTRAQSVSIQLSIAAHTSGSLSNLLVKIDRSLVQASASGGTLWEPSFLTLALATTGGVTTNTLVTNLPPSLIGGTGFLRMHLANTNAAGVITNIWLISSQKPGL